MRFEKQYKFIIKCTEPQKHFFLDCSARAGEQEKYKFYTNGLRVLTERRAAMVSWYLRKIDNLFTGDKIYSRVCLFVI